jgi:P27 family predicted phage terminase small subunit
VMPDWLSAFPVAVEEWKRESEILNGMGIMTVADASVLAIRCYLASEIQSMATELETEGRVVYQQKMDSLGNKIMEAKANPKAVQLAKAIVEYRQHGTLLGFDPSSRSRLSVIDPNKKQSKFTGLVNGGKK